MCILVPPLSSVFNIYFCFAYQEKKKKKEGGNPFSIGTFQYNLSLFA